MEHQTFEPLDHLTKEPSKVKFQPSFQPYSIIATLVTLNYPRLAIMPVN